jgi:VMA21-like domain
LHPQNKEIGQKLGLATGLMFTMPFVAFYIAMQVFSHKQSPENWAGAVAIVMTNIIVGGYCYLAFIEDRDDNDRDGPQKGSFKQRVD